MSSTTLQCASCHGVLENASRKKTTFEGAGISALHRFFEHYHQLSQSTPERPRKRQRLNESDDEDAESHVPIACVTLRISSAGNEAEEEAEERRGERLFEDAIQVEMIDVEKVEEKLPRRIRCGPSTPVPFVPRPLKITIAGPLKNGPCATIETVDEFDEETIRTLRNAAYLARRARQKKRGVATAQCQLVRESASFVLKITILWSDGASAFGPMATKDSDWNILTTFFPETNREVIPEFTSQYASRKEQFAQFKPQDFYSCLYSPPTNQPTPQALNEDILKTELYPFQKRAVAWMMDRENLTEKSNNSSFAKANNAINGHCFVSHLEGVVSSSPSSGTEPLRGGILAEEMGLGKTCELISLICLNQRAALPEAELTQAYNGKNLISSRATLIVTPETIRQQWMEELTKHAPHLSVLEYNGMSAMRKYNENEEELVHDFATVDVVVTTYTVLAREVHFAIEPPERSLRQRKTTRERPRSPLVRMNWWRVCLDEAQMVESGVSAAAQVASLLSRENAWAVTGTPLRKDVEDLLGLLIFLRYRPFCDSSVIWKRLITQYKSAFTELFGRITLRHTKDKIRNELRLPPQRRVVLTMPFTAIEEQNYKSLFEDMCYSVGCATDGSPLYENWDPRSQRIVENMRNFLVRLRQTCLHPQVGGRNRRALGRGNGPLRTVAEVLEVMIEQNETAVRTESRSAVTDLIARAHIVANAKDDMMRSEKALEIYKTALQQAEEIVTECRAELVKLGAADGAAGASEEPDDEQDKSPEHAARTRSRAGLHMALGLQHACAFFVGTAYFQIKSNEAITEPNSEDFMKLEDLETQYYDAAKKTRRELLRGNAAKAENLMEKVEEYSVLGVKESALSSMDSPGGIENMRIVSKAEDLAETLDRQAELINQWGSKVIELLLKPLVDEDEGLETTGDEYEDSTKQQDTLYAYTDALRAIIADRGTCITGQSAPLIDHEMNVLVREARDGNGHSPELLLQLLAQRRKLQQKPDELLSLRGLIHEARALETSLEWQEGKNVRAGAELSILQRQIKFLGKVSTDETKVFAKLEKVLELIRSTMNQRLEFYRQLQLISDTVAPYREELDETLDMGAFNSAVRTQEARVNTLAQLKTKRRFLLHLRDESNSSSEAERICVICQFPFEQGVLTVCGHQYCKDCISHWWKQHRTCPVCKRRLNLTDFHEVTYKPQELHAQEETHTHSESPSPGRSESPTPQSSSIYTDIGSETLSQIKSVDLNGSYGTKIDTLARHILWLRAHDAGAKSIVFSQYREFLDVLGTAFKQFGIGFSRMGKAGAVDKFQQDASVEVFLLDAKTDSSGLNLINAQYVFLAEPLINTALELQAIARVHRIGQRRPTTVYMYLISDTVEEAIYDISVTRRLAQMRKSSLGKSRSVTPMLGEAAIDSANSLEMQQAVMSKVLVKGQTGGEVVAQDDLWGCLFGKANTRKPKISDHLQAEVGRHVRAEAAEDRRTVN